MTAINHNDDDNNDGALRRLTVYPPSILSSFLPSFYFLFITKTSLYWKYQPWSHVSKVLCRETFTWTAACCCCKLHHDLSLFPVDWGQLQGHQHVCSWENATNWERSRLSLRHEHAMKVFRVCCVKKHELSGDLHRANRAKYTKSKQTAMKVLFSFNPCMFEWGHDWTCWFLYFVSRRQQVKDLAKLWEHRS